MSQVMSLDRVKTLHRRAMELSDRAFQAKSIGGKAQALSFFRDALEAESEACSLVATRFDLEPTRSILHRSAATLALDCSEFPTAERLIAIAFEGEPPDEIAEELRGLLHRIEQETGIAQRKSPPLSRVRQAAMLLKQASEPTRAQILLILVSGPQEITTLCTQIGQSEPAVSHHLALLREGGIITTSRQGKSNDYSLTETGLRLAHVVHALLDPGDEQSDSLVNKPMPERSALKSTQAVSTKTSRD